MDAGDVDGGHFGGVIYQGEDFSAGDTPLIWIVLQSTDFTTTR